MLHHLTLQEGLELSLHPHVLQKEAVSRPAYSKRHLKDWQVSPKAPAPLSSLYIPGQVPVVLPK